MLKNYNRNATKGEWRTTTKKNYRTDTKDKYDMSNPKIYSYKARGKKDTKVNYDNLRYRTIIQYMGRRPCVCRKKTCTSIEAKSGRWYPRCIKFHYADEKDSYGGTANVVLHGSFQNCDVFAKRYNARVGSYANFIERIGYYSRNSRGSESNDFAFRIFAVNFHMLFDGCTEIIEQVKESPSQYNHLLYNQVLKNLVAVYHDSDGSKESYSDASANFAAVNMKPDGSKVQLDPYFSLDYDLGGNLKKGVGARENRIRTDAHGFRHITMQENMFTTAGYLIALYDMLSKDLESAVVLQLAFPDCRWIVPATDNKSYNEQKASRYSDMQFTLTARGKLSKTEINNTSLAACREFNEEVMFNRSLTTPDDFVLVDNRENSTLYGLNLDILVADGRHGFAV